MRAGWVVAVVVVVVLVVGAVMDLVGARRVCRESGDGIRGFDSGCDEGELGCGVGLLLLW